MQHTMNTFKPCRRLDLIQGTPEWEAHRKQYRNASESAAVLGISPWVSPKQLYASKLGLAAQPHTNAMHHGATWEPRARAAWNEQYSDLDHPYAPGVFVLGQYSASCDGYCAASQSLVEIKCPPAGKESSVWRSIEQSIIPKYYRVQIEHQLRCSGAKQGWLWVWDARSEQGIRSAVVVPDDAIWSEIQVAWDSFEEYVKTQTPPPEPEVVERTDDQWLQLAEERIALEQQYKRLTTQLNENRDYLIALCTADKQVGGGITVTKYQREGSIDYKRIPALKGLDLSPYRKPPVEQVRITLQEALG